MHLTAACAQVFAWGLNTSGQLGLNDALTRKSPAVVDALWAMPVQQLAAGQYISSFPILGRCSCVCMCLYVCCFSTRLTPCPC